MSTDEHLKQQLAEYFDWLEDHLGSDLRSSPTGVVREQRRRVGRAVLAVLGVGSVIALAVVTVSQDRQKATTVLPAPTVDDVSSTVLPTSPATTWAPMNLPGGMTVVDVSWGSDLPGSVVPLASQHFARLSADGQTDEASLGLNVKATDQAPPEIGTGYVRGFPAVVVQSEDTFGVAVVTGWWVEDGFYIEFAATGFTLQQTIDLLDASAWRSDPTSGLDPDSVADHLSLLFETVGATPRPYTRFIIESDAGYVTVEVGNGNYGARDAEFEIIPGVGRVLSSPWETVVLTDDGSVISLSGSGINGDPVGVGPGALAIARSIAPVDNATVVALAGAAVARLQALPAVGRLAVGPNDVILRGGTGHLPEALCVVVSGVEACSFNRRLLSHGLSELGWTYQWILVGDSWLFVTYRPDEPAFGSASVCAADANGSLGDPLPYDEAVEPINARLFTVTQIPADAAFTAVCGWQASDEPFDLLPSNNISEIERRPPAIEPSDGIASTIGTTTPTAQPTISTIRPLELASAPAGVQIVGQGVRPAARQDIRAAVVIKRDTQGDIIERVIVRVGDLSLYVAGEQQLVIPPNLATATSGNIFIDQQGRTVRVEYGLGTLGNLALEAYHPDELTNAALSAEMEQIASVLNVDAGHDISVVAPLPNGWTLATVGSEPLNSVPSFYQAFEVDSPDGGPRIIIDNRMLDDPDYPYWEMSQTLQSAEIRGRSGFVTTHDYFASTHPNAPTPNSSIRWTILIWEEAPGHWVTMWVANTTTNEAIALAQDLVGVEQADWPVVCVGSAIACYEGG